MTPVMAVACYAPQSGPAANGVGNAPLGGFLIDGATFGVMTTGNVVWSGPPGPDHEIDEESAA